MGEGINDLLRVHFDSRLNLRFIGSKVTSDAGLLAYREQDEILGLTEIGAEVLIDLRLGSNKQHQLLSLLRQSIYSRLAGDEDVNDAVNDWLSIPPCATLSAAGQHRWVRNRRPPALSADSRPKFSVVVATSRH